MNLKKAESLKALKEILNSNSFISVYQKNGLNSSEVIQLKQHIQLSNLHMKSIKNTSIKVLLQETSHSYFVNLFEGPCLLVYSKEIQSNTSQMFSLHKKFDKLVPLGALIQDGYLSAKEFDWMASLPNLKTVYAGLADLCASSLAGTISSLDVIQGELSLIVNQSNT